MVQGEDKPKPLSGPWLYTWPDKLGDLKSLVDTSWKILSRFPMTIPEREGRQYLALTTFLPSGNYSDPAIYLERVYLLAKVYLDDELLYEFGKLDPSISERFLGLTWHMVPLPDSWAGKKLTILFRSDYNVIGLKHPVMLGNKSDHIRSMFVSDLPRMILSCLFLFLAMGIILFVMREARFPVAHSFAALCAGAAFHTMYYSSVKTLIFDAPLFWNYIWIIATALMLIGALFMVAYLFPNFKRPVLYLLLLLHGIYTILTIFLFAFRRYDIVPALTTGRFALYILELAISIFFIVMGYKPKEREHHILIGGLALFLGAMGLDLLAAMQTVPYYHFGTHWGLLFLIGSFSIVIIGRLKRMIQFSSEFKAKLQLTREQERERIYADLHDHLGGRLNDLSILARQIVPVEQDKALAEGIDDCLRMLRERLTSLEDLQTLSKDFILGMQIILVRRFTLVGRLVRISISDELRNYLSHHDLDELIAPLYTILMEIATNDLKYGKGLSQWEFDLIHGKHLGLQISITTKSTYTLSLFKGGRGKSTIRMRIEDAGGAVLEGPAISDQGFYHFSFWMPLEKSFLSSS